MTDTPIRFDDGAAYERMMGIWSALAGEIFLGWLAMPKNLSWLDVGCGNGAFTEQIIRHNAPSAVEGIDPSEGQIAYAKTRAAAAAAKFRLGDAMALPFAADGFDAAVMALVIFFVPDPAKGVAEMARVVRPGGVAAAYAWDMNGGGFPLEIILKELRAMGLSPIWPPSADASRREEMVRLWTDAGFEDVETRRIDVTRTYVDIDDFWSAASGSLSLKTALAKMEPAQLADLKARVRVHLSEATDGRVTVSAFSNAVKGRVPK
ncbi:MAG: methyltransferase domain-containing protein [Xanthobacteraceae bacterium]|nr:methyltransferase domain-containing protein [Xanthobacteraceae bacterium]